MGFDKEFLVKVNFEGSWKKNEDNVWRYDALKSKYIRLHWNTSYASLVDMLYEETEIRREENKIEVHAWDCYPNKQEMPPFELSKDSDVATLIELNSKRDVMIPLCVTATVIESLKRPREVRQTPQFHSQSVNQQCIRDDFDITLRDHPGIDDIHFTKSKIMEDAEQSTSCGDDNDDYFEEVDDGYDHFDEIFDPYFRVFLNPSESPRIMKNKPTDKPRSPGCKKDVSRHFTGSTGNDNKEFDTGDVNDGAATVESSNVHMFEDFKIGEIVGDKSTLILRLRIISMKANREFRVTRSDKKRFLASCVDKKCNWTIRSTHQMKVGSWTITQYTKLHTCSIDLRSTRLGGVATSAVVAQMVKEDGMEVNKIKEMLQRVYGVQITYWKAWKAKEIALQLVRGLPEDSFKGLAQYLWLLEQANPGSHTAYQLDHANCFRQCFVAIGSCVSGFRSSIRPVIAVDATHLKGRYRGKLFIATAMDGNRRIYPLAFGVAATENDECWTWFFNHVKRVVGSRDDLVFISDRHPSIEKCCKEVFPNAVLGICMFHLGLNMASRYKVKAETFLYGAAKAYTEAEFEERMHSVQSTNKIVYDYLMEADPKKWARCYFPSRRYSIMTTNIAESMNAVLRDAREFPIIGMLETVRLLLQTWFYNRYKEAVACDSVLTPDAEKVLRERDDSSRRYTVHGLDQYRFNMVDARRNLVVDIGTRTCGCKVFQLDQLPCDHAIRACRERNISVYDMCSRFYHIDALRLAYVIPVMPVPHRSEWNRLVPDSVKEVVIKPPIMKPKVGRQKKKRICSQGEDSNRRKCSKCKEHGHNKKTCRGIDYVAIHRKDIP